MYKSEIQFVVFGFQEGLEEERRERERKFWVDRKTDKKVRVAIG